MLTRFRTKIRTLIFPNGKPTPYEIQQMSEKIVNKIIEVNTKVIKCSALFGTIYGMNYGHNNSKDYNILYHVGNTICYGLNGAIAGSFIGLFSIVSYPLLIYRIIDRRSIGLSVFKEKPKPILRLS